ncbi:hypothetical protein V2A60_010350 [Cordyceps javanica]|uniref:Tat pathway signal sequence n=1 Tax=Cordyceps javanica TaxID=43265 RepID=A0A545UUT4_9HYPO|nr:hypothetical protein IF1G_07793 [Cordyceps javanica]TQW05423.1 hypothetical protein IF2G_07360 [Cordyceps javanica]
MSLPRCPLPWSKPKIRLSKLEEAQEENDAFIPQSQIFISDQNSNYRKVKSLLIVIAILESIIAVALITWQYPTKSSCNRNPGWVTEIGPRFPVLEMERVRFDAGLDLDAAGHVVLVGGVAGAPQFTGPPSDEIDSNWDSLIPSDMNITRGEAEQIGGDFYFYPGTDIATIEISSFHILHCLDQARRSVHWRHYYPQGLDKLHEIHIDHCIDAIRQFVQCHVDLTPINLVWSENKGGILPDFQQVHTCPSFQQAHEWVMRRNIANYENGIGDEDVADHARRTLKRLGLS